MRILGYHDTDDLKDEELPLAHILLPPNTTTVGGRTQTVQYQGGEIVLGFFFDGEELSTAHICDFISTRFSRGRNYEYVFFRWWI